MDDKIITALITSGIGVAVGIVWRVVNHYRLRSECNKDNQLVVSVVNTDTNKNVAPTELKEIAVEIKNALP